MGNSHIDLNEYETCLLQLETWLKTAGAAKMSSTPERSPPGLHGRDLVRFSDIISGLTQAAQSLRTIYLDVGDLCADTEATA